MTNHAAIERCREALDSDDLLAVATRNDWVELVYAYDSLAALLLVAQSHIRYAMESSTTTISDDPGCFWCDTPGHSDGCPVNELNTRIDKELNP